ncbi:unnamed protein product [Nippostrongylus brasiliensis]|uniref:PHD-type domain-containing protein n=1 Tax=Nippostrongylus brasiliensis TaxID=27835 RepID=A0A0N4Y9S8_NIPBR|nr:unnamed protein product [Nippostrongylus brasiliensis]
MPLAELTNLIVTPAKKLFSDISNMVNSPDVVAKKIESEEIESGKQKFSARHIPEDFCHTYEQAMQQENDRLIELREKIEKPVIQELCNRIHHSTYTLDDLVESIESYLEDFYIKGENVEFTPGKDRTVIAKILGVEKKGGAVFYTLFYDDKEIGRICGRDLKRRYEITEDDIRSLILLVGSQQPGKPWQVEEVYKKEYGVKDKLAPIFCGGSAQRKSNKIVNTTGRTPVQNDGDSDSDAPLSHFVNPSRSDVALPPNASAKALEKERKKQEKKELKEKEKRERKEMAKKEKEKKKAEKKEAKENDSWTLNKFISSPSANGEKKANGSTNTPFLTPQKRSEKRFNAAVSKLQEAWRKRDEQEFINAAAWGAKILSGAQIDKIPHECHQFAVRKAYLKVKDAEALKKLRTKEERRAFREKRQEERQRHQKIMLAKIKAYFSQEIIEEDLVACENALPCPGRLVSVPDGQSLLFTDCIVFTQFFSTLKNFIEADHKISSRQLFDAVHEGRPGFMRCTWRLFGSLLKTLLLDPEYKVRSLIIVPQKVNAAVDNDEENGGDAGDTESGRGSPCELNDMSQIDIDVCKTFLDNFTADKELWELCPEDQLGILGLLLNRILDLKTFKEYIGQEGLTRTAQSLREKVKKLQEQSNSWLEELAALPEFEEVSDPSLLSRTATRERAEIQKQRDALERKIEENKVKLEELFGKLALEKMAKAQSKRVEPIGQDRHFRRYYWFHGNSADDGIWIQDMGITSYEKFIRECIKSGKPFEAGDEESVKIESDDAEKQPADDWPVLEPESCTETWYRLADEESLEGLLTSLVKSGVREGKLLAFLKKNKDVILQSITRGSARQSKSPDPVDEAEDEDLCSESMTPLKKSVIQLASDLRDSYLTSIGGDFDAELLCCSTLEEVKEKLRDLADSITPSAIVRKLEMKVAFQTGQYSHLIIERWRQRLAECQNASAVHLLRSYLDSRIDWKQSVVEKRCNSCGSRRSPEAKIACANCATVLHYYCARPRLEEKPTSWLCTICQRAEQKKKQEEEMAQHPPCTKTGRKVVNYVDKTGSSSESGEEDSDEGENDCDFFGVKHPRRSFRKRAMKDFFEDDVEDKRSRAKRSKVNPASEECIELLGRVKAYHRLYRTLQNIPAIRSSRRATPSSIDALEGAIHEYSTLSSFAADLDTFFKHARSYLEEHNERKLEELENLLIELDLRSFMKP